MNCSVRGNCDAIKSGFSSRNKEDKSGGCLIHTGRAPRADISEKGRELIFSYVLNRRKLRVLRLEMSPDCRAGKLKEQNHLNIPYQGVSSRHSRTSKREYAVKL